MAESHSQMVHEFNSPGDAMIEITGWPGEDTDPALGMSDVWDLAFAAWIYREHVLDSLADFKTGYYAAIPLTMTWRRNATSE